MTARRPARPSSVRIGYATYSVEYLSSKEWARRLGTENCGETHNATQSIYLILDHPSGPVTDSFMKETLLHEIMHGCMSLHGVDQTMEKVERDDREEVIVSGLSPVLFGVLRNNPKLTSWLLAD